MSLFIKTQSAVLVGVLISLFSLSSFGRIVPTTQASSVRDFEFFVIPIVVLNPNLNNERPRDAEPVPIYAVGSRAVVTMWFDRDLGTVTITLINGSTGEDYLEIADTSVGMAEIPITGTDGHYVLSIRLANGAGYGGEFDLFE